MEGIKKNQKNHHFVTLIEAIDLDDVFLPTNNMNLIKPLHLNYQFPETQIEEHVNRHHKDVINQFQNLDYSLKLRTSTVSSTTKWQPVPRKKELKKKG